jgi:hypothetical protein
MEKPEDPPALQEEGDADGADVLGREGQVDGQALPDLVGGPFWALYEIRWSASQDARSRWAVYRAGSSSTCAR